MSAPAREGIAGALRIESPISLVVELGIINPVTIEGNGGVNDGSNATPSTNIFLTAIGMEKHQVGARFDFNGVKDLRHPDSVFVAEAWQAAIDDIVIDSRGKADGKSEQKRSKEKESYSNVVHRFI